MPIPLDSLRRSAARYTGQRFRSLSDAKARGSRSGFLCHSHKDAESVKGLIERLRESGLDLYVDWEDESMPDEPDRRTATRIQQMIKASDYFLFLATPNSTASRWCPWEIGYADGAKATDHILVITTTDASGQHYGNEYLQLYRKIDEVGQRLEVFEPGQRFGIDLRRL